jgi:DNA polymerase IIIc chi subunit
VEERKEMIKFVDILLEESESDQKEMVDGIIDMLNQVKDINNRKEMALDRLKDFKKQNIKINITDFLQKSGLLSETWTKKYKKSIDCSNPKGFSQRAHCAGRRKRKHGGKTKSKPV